MKTASFIFILFLLSSSSRSQNTHIDYGSAIKIYNLSGYEEDKRITRLNDTVYQVSYQKSLTRILHPTVAFQWRTKKNNFHEIELTDLVLARSCETNNSYGSNGVTDRWVSTVVSLRYEYILNFLKSKDLKLVPSLGFGINPYYRNDHFSSNLSTTFPVTETYAGAKLLVTPRLCYYPFKRFFVDLNIPLCLSRFYYLSETEKNPTVQAQQHRVSSMNFDMFPMVLSGRIGVGIKL